MAALALGFTACEDESEAIPQSNPQLPIMSADGLTVEAIAADTVNLKALSDAGEQAAVLDIVSNTNFPATSQLQLVMQLSKSGDYSSFVEVPVSVVENVAYVSPADWQAAHLKEFGKSQKTREAYIRFAPWAVNGTSTVRIGNPDYYIGQDTLAVTPIPSDIVIEEAYYLLGTINGWDVATAIPFVHTGDVYENPIFTLKVEISAEEAAAGWWWKVVPQSTYETGNWVDAKNASYGVEENGDSAMEGILYGRPSDTEDCGAGCITQAGQWLMTLDMENCTYAFTSAIEFLYTPGGSNGWSHGSSQLLYTSDYAIYTGYAYLTTDGFKFTDAPDWSHGNYGLGAEEGTLANGSNTNLPVDVEGLYWLSVNLPALTYTKAQVTTYGIIGDATPGGWDASTALTPSADYLYWEGEVELKGSGELKFRANDAWDINLGGDINNLTPGGANIPTPGAGKWYVGLDLTVYPYTAYFEKID